MAKRWVLYNYDLDELATKRAYHSYEEAAGDADSFGDCLVIGLGDVDAHEIDASPEPDFDRHEEAIGDLEEYDLDASNELCNDDIS